MSELNVLQIIIVKLKWTSRQGKLEKEKTENKGMASLFS